MKITNALNTIRMPWPTDTVRTGSPHSDMGGKATRKSTPVAGRLHSTSAKPVDILSTDELRMLNRLFTKEGQQTSLVDSYTRHRKQVRTSTVGMLLDVKR